MRITEITEGILDKFIKPKMKFNFEIQGEELYCDVTLGNKRVAGFTFDMIGNDLEAQDMHVVAEYRGQGIAKQVYDMLKAKGYRIHRSQHQTDAGAHFWDKNKQQDRVWEEQESRITTKVEGSDEYGYSVTGYVDGEPVGMATFLYDEARRGWYSEATDVDPEYQRMGVATAIYNTAREKIGHIVPSDDQTTDARALWKGKKIWEGRNADVPVYYFSYGMLTDPKLMSGLQMVGVAELPNFEYKMYSWANVEHKPGSKVYGVLWAIDHNVIATLDRAEGYPSLYDRRTYPVYVDGHKIAAEVYIMTPDTLEQVWGTKPTQGYVNRIVRGYRNAGVPMQQLQDALKISGIAKEPQVHANDPSPWADD